MTEVFSYTAVGIVFLYGLVVLVPGFIFFFKKPFEIKTENKLPVSIIIAARNEEQHIAACVSALRSQLHSPEKTEIIIVNDHSEDDTKRILQELSLSFPELKCIDLPNGKAGKKNAIEEGVKNANSDILLFTDADCVMKENWLQEMTAPFVNEKVILVSGPVGFHPSQRLNIFLNEQIALQMTSAGMMMMNVPVLLSGANYACRKKLFAGKDALDEKYVSGDDSAIMEKAKRNGKLVFVKNRHAIVRTNAPGNISEAITQRARWISKTGGIGNSAMRFTGLVVLFSNLVVPILFALILTGKSAVSIAAFCLYSKILIDVLLLSLSVPFFREPLVLLTLPLSEICYPFIMLAAIFRSFTGKILWKGRTWKN